MITVYLMFWICLSAYACVYVTGLPRPDTGQRLLTSPNGETAYALFQTRDTEYKGHGCMMHCIVRMTIGEVYHKMKL